MRHIAIALLLACGSSTAQPSEPEPISEPQRPIDAGVADAAIDAPDVVPADAAPLDAGNLTFEDGIRVIRTNHRVWCATKPPRLCAGTAVECRKTFNVKCVRRDAYACFIATARTSGNAMMGCFYDYGACQEGAFDAGQNPEIASMGDCMILRYDAGAE